MTYFSEPNLMIMKLKTTLIFLLTSILIVKQSSGQDSKEIYKKHKKFKKNFPAYQFIPSGAFSIAENKDSMVSFRSFYMHESEISNYNYLEFIMDMENKVKPDSLLKLLPDSTVWKAYHRGKSLVNYYFKHPAYRNYPVVGITHDQALAFCSWLTNKLNESESMPFAKIVARLPKKSEWEYAANGNKEGNIFPWDGYELIDEKYLYLANFKVISQASIKKVESDTILITSRNNELIPKTPDYLYPIHIFKQNAFGLFNMAGNASEYVEEKGVLKGGSFNSTGYYLNLYHSEKYSKEDYRSAETGFRIVIQIIEY